MQDRLSNRHAFSVFDMRAEKDCPMRECSEGSLPRLSPRCSMHHLHAGVPDMHAYKRGFGRNLMACIRITIGKVS